MGAWVQSTLDRLCGLVTLISQCVDTAAGNPGTNGAGTTTILGRSGGGTPPDRQGIPRFHSHDQLRKGIQQHISESDDWSWRLQLLELQTVILLMHHLLMDFPIHNEL